MPRPDLEALGVNYRRIPVVAIGEDIYCDTLLILQKLEQFYPAESDGGSDGIKPRLGAVTPEMKALELLLEKWTDVLVFPRAAADCIPLDHPLVQDEKFIKDRAELWGESWDRETRAKKRPVALVNMRECFDLLENTILGDGREWIGGSEGPTLLDIHSAWIFDWMMQLDGSWPEDLISSKRYSKTFAWCGRYRQAVDGASGKNEVIEGPEAYKRVMAAGAVESRLTGVDGHDPLGLKEGDTVKVAPMDTGYTAAETGQLLVLDAMEVVIETKTKPKEGPADSIRLHCPRWNFSIEKVMS